MSNVNEGPLWCVVMAGGAGTRFWPASTESKPKQLLTLVGDRSLLQLSVDRARALVPAERVLVITNAALADACRAQLPDLPAGNVVAEPVRRDTAAAVALAMSTAPSMPCGCAWVTMADARAAATSSPGRLA
jgi:mannose-1-phosphate guanylyltransferase